MNKLFIKKNIWRLYPILIFVGIILFSYFQGKKYLNRFYNNSLNNIIIKRNNWQIRATEFYFENGIYIDSTNTNRYNLQLGDSIVKKADSYTFRVYRKDSTGKYWFVKQYTLKH